MIAMINYYLTIYSLSIETHREHIGTFIYCIPGKVSLKMKLLQSSDST